MASAVASAVSTGMRAALGFNEVEAAWRHFIEGEEKPDCLTFDRSVVACRYLAETVVRKDDLARVKRDLGNYQRLRDLTDEWIELSIELAKLDKSGQAA